MMGKKKKETPRDKLLRTFRQRVVDDLADVDERDRESKADNLDVLVPLYVIADSLSRIAAGVEAGNVSTKALAESLDTGVAEFQDVMQLARDFMSKAPMLMAKMGGPK